MSDLAQTGCGGGTSRRHFLKAAAGGGAMGTLASTGLAGMDDGPAPGQAGVPTVTLTRGQSWPVQYSVDTGQVVGLTDGLQAVSVKFASRVPRHTVQLTGLSQSDFDALWAFLWHPLIDGSQQPLPGRMSAGSSARCAGCLTPRSPGRRRVTAASM